MIARNDVRVANALYDRFLGGALAEGFGRADYEVGEDRIVVGVLPSG